VPAELGAGRDRGRARGRRSGRSNGGRATRPEPRDARADGRGGLFPRATARRRRARAGDRRQVGRTSDDPLGSVMRPSYWPVWAAPRYIAETPQPASTRSSAGSRFVRRRRAVRGVSGAVESLQARAAGAYLVSGARSRGRGALAARSPKPEVPNGQRF
jgi:hypothetical protein